MGASLEDLGKGLRSMTGTIFSTKAKGVRYLELTEGYITRVALDENNEAIGYEFVRLGKMMEMIRQASTRTRRTRRTSAPTAASRTPPNTSTPREQ